MANPSLFSVTVSVGAILTNANVLAAPATSPAKTALQVACDAAVAAISGSAVVSASQLGGRPSDLLITPAVSPATDGTPKALYQVSYQAGSGSGGTNPSPSLVLSNPQTASGVITSAADGAIATAMTLGGGTPNAVSLLGMVSIDAT
jgi:hypothetical protein